MIFGEYITPILHELVNAGNCDEVEQIINRSVNQLPEDDWYRHLEIIYLHLLQYRLEEFARENFDTNKWRNIRHSVNYLEKMNVNRNKKE